MSTISNKMGSPVLSAFFIFKKILTCPDSSLAMVARHRRCLWRHGAQRETASDVLGSTLRRFSECNAVGQEYPMLQ